jgi:hypothetical protein
MKRIVMFSLMLILTVLLAACGPQGVEPDDSGILEITQEDSEEGMNFSPDAIILTAGQKVRIVLENHGSKDHEFMVGRDVVYTADGAPNGFEVDFFEGIEDLVEVNVGEGAMLMIDGETVQMGGMEMEGDEMGDEMSMGEEDEHAEEEDEHMDHMGWMVMNAAGSDQTIIEFTVPADRVGEWEMGCFEDDGTHYDDGMRGTLVVVEP